MTKLEEDIYNALLVKEGIDKVVDGNPITAHNCKVHARAAAEVAKQAIIDFMDWYNTLSPASKCTVWPPAGSGSSTGIYNMETKDLVDKFLSRKTE